MKIIKLLCICALLYLFTGCEGSKKSQEKLLKEDASPSSLSIFTEDITPITPTPPSTTSKTEPTKIPAKSDNEGKATHYETSQAAKKEPIPLQEIPADKVFKSASEMGPEIAKLFANVHFDYDRYSIRVADVAILTNISKYLIQKPNIEIIVSGHCDERGTREYNLVLGEQRALSVRSFLVELGVSPKRIFTSSYGKDLPIDTRSNEEAWTKNRRAEFGISE
jgi:peptidoglycan-associated lipoprotein